MYTVMEELMSQKNDKEPVYRASTSPLGLPISKMMLVLFPLSIKESFSHYQTRHNVLAAQEGLLSLVGIELLPNMEMNVLRVPIWLDELGKVVLHKNAKSETPHFINEVCIAPKGMTEEEYSKAYHMVVIHGYGAGLGFFVKNLAHMARYLNDRELRPRWCIHAIDLLGYGASSRPEINYKTNGSLESFEKWFIDSIESWRAQRQLDDPKKTLVVAHSMGAYLSLCYNIKYPNKFKKLVLVSPAGIIEPAQFDHKKVPKWFDFLWNQNVSPFSIVRNTGPLGSLFVSGWSSRRFAKLSAKERKLLHKYTYAIFNAKGSGEYFLNYVLRAGGIPRHPFVKNAERMSKITCETLWLYGEHDWMDARGGALATKYLKEAGLKSDLRVFNKCGHHIYLDDIKSFNQYLIDQIEAFSSKEAQR